MNIRTESLRLSTADGAMPAHLATPAQGGPYPGVIVVMEAFGLNGHIKTVGERVAREGYVVIAPDLYHRFGSPIVAYEDIPKAIDYLKQLDDARVIAEIRACIDALKARRDVRADRIGITGFCMGGRIAFLAAARLPGDIKAAVSFYGGGIGADHSSAPINQASRIQAPVLAL
jgi:carboxymethylenebutenolidase